MFFIEELLEVDPEKKKGEQGLEWANRTVTQLRTYWRPLIEPEVARKNMDIILSNFDMDKVKKMFKDPQKLGMEFIPLSVMEKIRNILVGERVKADINVNLNAVDPTAESDRERDKSLLRNRSKGEALFSTLQRSIGLPDYSLASEKKLKGKSPFKGNAEMFDKLGLDENSDYQIAYFFEVWHRLLAEMRGQEVVNFTFNYNKVKSHVNKWVNDILGKKCIAAQAFVNEITGAMELKYVAPENVRLVHGKNDDGSDAPCVGVEEVMTVGQMIKRIGSEFNMTRDLPYLLNAVNSYNNKEYTGIWDGQTTLYGSGETYKLIRYDQFLGFKVQVGYIEWKTYNCDVSKMGVDYHGNLIEYRRSANWQPSEQDSQQGYAREAFYTEHTYKAFYLSTSSNTQRLYKYGPLTYQAVEGQEDEFSCYSILLKKEAGPTVAEVARPWIEIIQECFTKGRWMVRRAKPKGRSYSWDSLLQIANKMYGASGDNRTKVLQVMSLFDEGVNEIHVIPTVGGQPVGGGQNPNFELPNGVDQGLLTFRDIISWAVENIKADLGINDIREAYSPNPNDGYKLQMQTLESSRNATDYIERMIDDLLVQMATRTLHTTQDVIRFKDSLAYSFLERAIGSTSIRDIADLDGVAFHRYGIFVNSFANYMDRQKVLSETEQAWQKGEITYEIKMLINSVDDYRKAAFILAFEKERAKKEEQQQLDAERAHEAQMEQLRHQNKMEEIATEKNLEIRRENVRGMWYYKSATAQAASREQVKQMSVEAEPEKIDRKAAADIQKMEAKAHIDRQAPVV
jgi:hypothetical protein